MEHADLLAFLKATTKIMEGLNVKTLEHIKEDVIDIVKAEMEGGADWTDTQLAELGKEMSHISAQIARG